MGRGSWAFGKGVARGRFLEQWDNRGARGRVFFVGVVLGVVVGMALGLAIGGWLL